MWLNYAINLHGYCIAMSILPKLMWYLIRYRVPMLHVDTKRAHAEIQMLQARGKINILLKVSQNDTVSGKFLCGRIHKERTDYEKQTQSA